jgi:uncharacterized membrane protein
VTVDPLDLPATTYRVRNAARAAKLDERATARALEIATATPRGSEWRAFLSKTLALFGAGLVVAGAICFVAYNWERFGRFSKFALVEGAIIVATIAAWRTLPRTIGQVSLLAAAVLVGPLLAIYGQTYQTGADPYGLFLTWAWLILPWVIVGRFAALWLLAVIVFDVGLVLYWQQMLGFKSLHVWLWLPMAIAALHLGLVAAFEWQLRRGHVWIRERWGARVLVATGFWALWIPAAATVVFDTEAGVVGLIAILALAGAIAGAFRFYRRIYPDRFLVTMAVTAGMGFVSVAVGRVLFDILKLEILGFLLMTGFVIWEITVGVSWFRGSRGTTAQGES